MNVYFFLAIPFLQTQKGPALFESAGAVMLAT